jgi:phenylpyruvate tautomerase PptA (4-oxalocrotonate tautomerase family)
VELKSIGYSAGGVEKIASALCALVSNHLHVPSGRIFTVFHDVKAPMWGQGGGMFG